MVTAITDFIENVKTIYNKYNELIISYTELLHSYISKNYPNLCFMLPILMYINQNPLVFMTITIILSYLFSGIILSTLFFLLLINCVILSLFVLNSCNIKNKSKRLARNIISLAILYFNPLGAVITLVTVFFLFNDTNKVITSLIIKFVEKIFNFISSNIPIIAKLYPSIKEINNIKKKENKDA
jgi:uncharacterized membrane protein